MNERPKITVSSVDVERLERMIDSLRDDQFPGKDDLLDELDRADVVAPEAMPGNIVTMNSTVRFRVESSGKEFSFTLVYPQKEGSTEGTISILTPVGAALLGLAEGDQIAWPRPGGGMLSVQIIAITYQPERVGELHR
jgi:regulator of nucleoside diphosphate kinase